MKALVIGGTGFVGGYLLKHLTKDLHWDVYFTTKKHEKEYENDRLCRKLDILDREQMKQVLWEIKPDYIFHLAAQSSVSQSWKKPDLTVDINVKGTINLMEAVRELEIKPRILLAGSGEEYGHISQDEIPIQENTLLRPGNIYAATKACQNMLGKIYADAYGLDIIMVRAFNHIGPKQEPIFVVADFCKQVSEIEKGLKEPVITTGNLNAKRDFTDVRDVVRAYALLAKLGKKGEVYNVGSGEAVEIQSILDQILTFSKVNIKAEVSPDKIRPVDVPIIEADISKINAITGWKPEIGLEISLQETLEYWRTR